MSNLLKTGAAGALLAVGLASATAVYAEQNPSGGASDSRMGLGMRNGGMMGMQGGMTGPMGGMTAWACNLALTSAGRLLAGLYSGWTMLPVPGVAGAGGRVAKKTPSRTRMLAGLAAPKAELILM